MKNSSRQAAEPRREEESEYGMEEALTGRTEGTEGHGGKGMEEALTGRAEGTKGHGEEEKSIKSSTRRRGARGGL